MHKISVGFKDLNDQQQNEDFYFDLNEEELISLEILHGGLAEYWKRIIEADNNHEIYSEFKAILEMSYGQKSPDGRRFIKSDETKAYLRSHVAFSKLIIGLITDTDAATAFMNNLIPSQEDLVVLAEQAKQIRQPTDYQRPTQTAHVGEELAENANTTFDKGLYEYTPAEMATWDDERTHAWRELVQSMKN